MGLFETLSQAILGDSDESAYDELIEVLASDDDGEMTIKEIVEITNWDEGDIVKRLRHLIQIKAISGKLHMGHHKIIFNSIDTTPYSTQKYRQILDLESTGPSVKEQILGVPIRNKNKKITHVVKCPNCGASRQVLGNNIVKCDYCDSLMEPKNL